MGKVLGGLLLAVAVWGSVHASAAPLLIGYNQAWMSVKYQTWLTSEFDVNEVRTVFRNIKANGGDVVRLWFFQNQQGLILARYAPQTSGIEQRMLDNIAITMDEAEKAGLQIYFTLFDGNSMQGPPATAARDYYYNLLNNKYGELDAFKKNALEPVLKVMSRKPGVIYALDLMNEIQAPIWRSYWVDRSNGPRAWIKTMRDSVRVLAPWLKVTSSSGWGWGQSDLESGFFSGLGLDFYDIHIYDNSGRISRAYGMCARAAKDGVPLILGEFGQESKYDDDNLQKNSTWGFLNNARNSCFTAALAWRFDAAESYWRFQRADGSFRPAVEVMKAF